MNTQLFSTAVKLSSALLLLALFVSSCSQDMTGTGDNSIKSEAVTSLAGAEAGTACEPGTFSSDGLSPCEPCPIGKYQPESGQTTCLDAPAGTFVAVEGSTEATLCEIGFYQDETGQFSCKAAPAGSFVAAKGATLASKCPLGRYQPETGQSFCFDAPEGSFVSTVGAEAATLCPIGEYTDFTGATACLACDAGFTTNGPGATSCVLATNDPVTKDDCKKGGWKNFDFKNQGQCVRFVNTGKDSR